MNTNHRTDEYNRIAQAAKLRAAQLRQEAIGEFWSSSGAIASQAARSAQRFANSLVRHARLRNSEGA